MKTNEASSVSTVVPTAPLAHVSQRSVHTYREMRDARDAAADVASTTGGRVFACTVFTQAGRIIVATSFPLASLRTMLQTQAATKGDDPRKVHNRPVDTDHVVKIRDYLCKNYPNYVLPALSVTYHEPLGIYTTELGKVRQGFIVIPDGLIAYISDGQHRFLALVGHKFAKPEIQGALDRVPDLANDSIAVLVTIEDQLERIHQDFADMAMTKPLPKSLLTAYDLRDPVNRLVYAVAKNCPLLDGRIDETSKTLSVKSRHVVLANWLRNLVKGAIASDYFVADADMHRYHDSVSDESELKILQDELVYLVNTLTETIPQLAEIAKIPPTSPAANTVPDLRDNVLATTAVGLGISGMILQRIRAQIPNPNERRPYIRALFEKVVWLRGDANNPHFQADSVWTHGGVLSGGIIKSSRNGIVTSVARILQRLGLSVEKRYQKALEAEPELPFPSASTVTTERRPH